MSTCTQTAGWKLAQEKSKETYRIQKELRIGDYMKSPKLCLTCNSVIPYGDRNVKKFCTRSCAATYNNANRKPVESHCIYCGNLITKHGKQYCTLECSQAHWLEIKVNKWKSGLFIRSEYIPDFIRNYMFTKYGNKCQLCGWGEIHPITGRIPLQIEHIDGDCTNHAETNLQLLCPNCHSLTPTYGALNKGKSTRFNRRLARENDRLGT